MRAVLFAIVLVITGVALAAPAQATVTASLVGNAPLTPTSNGWSYSGACPVNVTLKATINATAPSTFKYGFNRNSGLSALTGAAASPGTPYTATDSVSFTASGTYWEQLLVTAVSPGQADIYAPDRGVANIKITCGTGGVTGGHETSAKLVSHSGVYELYKLPAPTNVHVTTDPKECAAHLPPIAFLLIPVCGEILSQGGAEIVFSWEGTDQQPSADGFHVYNVAGHVLNPSLTTTGGGSDTVVFKKGPLYPVCFVLRAYKGSAESNDSQQVCLGGGVSVKTIFLNSTSARSYKFDHVCCALERTYGSSSSAIEVGYWHWYVKRFIGDYSDNQYSRAGVRFDVRSLNAKFIFKAVLHLHMTGGSNDPDPQSSSFPTRSCISEVGLGTNWWWQSGDQLDGNFPGSASPAGFQDITLDVTTAVREMDKSGSNLGFILRGSDENLGAFVKSKCMSRYAVPAQLEVTYN